MQDDKALVHFEATKISRETWIDPQQIVMLTRRPTGEPGTYVWHAGDHVPIVIGIAPEDFLQRLNGAVRLVYFAALPDSEEAWINPRLVYSVSPAADKPDMTEVRFVGRTQPEKFGVPSKIVVDRIMTAINGSKA